MPVKTVDKAVKGTTKRNADPAPPVRGTGAGSRRGGPGGNEGGELGSSLITGIMCG